MKRRDLLRVLPLVAVSPAMAAAGIHRATDDRGSAADARIVER